MQSAPSIGLINDFSKALGQQLFFWGCDVLHSKGNLLCEFGFEKYKREGVSGSSCYTTTFNEDIIELHSLCVGRYSKSTPSLLFTRRHRQCWVYDDNSPPPPGQYDPSLINKSSIEMIDTATRSFLEWWLEYESWISTATRPEYRVNCYHAYKRFTKSKSWLPPEDGLPWLQRYMHDPSTLPRAKQWKQAKQNKVLHPSVKYGRPHASFGPK